MALLSTAAQNASLDNDYGAAKGPNAAAAHKVRLYTADPLLGGTELAATGGYVAPVITNDGTTWPSAAADGAVTSMVVTFATSTAAWSDTATFFALEDDATGDLWDSGELADEINVDAAGADVSTQLTVYYEDLGA